MEYLCWKMYKHYIECIYSKTGSLWKKYIVTMEYFQKDLE